MSNDMQEIETRAAQQSTLQDDELLAAPDSVLKFWKDTTRELLGDSIKTIEETSKQVVVAAGILEGLYFHAIAFSEVRSTIASVYLIAAYLSPLTLWLISLLLALLVFFPRTYASNISSWRDSKASFERIVAYKHSMLKASSVFLVLGVMALVGIMVQYLAG